MGETGRTYEDVTLPVLRRKKNSEFTKQVCQGKDLRGITALKEIN